MKSLKIIKPGLTLIVPRTIPYCTNQLLFAFFFLSRLFFQGKVLWLWESELKENLAKLKELEGRWWGRKNTTCTSGLGGFHESRGCRAACGHWGCIWTKALFSVCGRWSCTNTIPELQEVSQERAACSTAATRACLCCDTISSKSPLPSPGRDTSRNILSTSHTHKHQAHFVWGSLELDGSIRPCCAALLMKLLRVIKRSSSELYQSNISYDIWNKPCWGEWCLSALSLLLPTHIGPCRASLAGRGQLWGCTSHPKQGLCITLVSVHTRGHWDELWNSVSAPGRSGGSCLCSPAEGMGFRRCFHARRSVPLAWSMTDVQKQTIPADGGQG